MHRYVAAFLALALPTSLRAQSLTLVLRDSISRQPLTGASVHVPGTGVGDTTDGAGLVRLTLTPVAGTRLRVAALEYRPRTVVTPAENSSPLVLLLAPNTAVEEVVVMAVLLPKNWTG